MRNLVLLLGLLAVTSSCTRDRTQIMLRIRTDMAQGSSGVLGSIRVRVSSAGAVDHDAVYDLDEHPLPATLALVPTTEREGLVSVAVDAVSPDGTVLFTKPAEARYVPERTLVLDITLADRCRDESARSTCSAGESCGLEGCEPDRRDQLTEYMDADASLPVAMDAGYDACVAQCEGVCTDTNQDPNNCGSCGNVCSAPPGAEPACSLGECGFLCPEGYHACDGMCADDRATESCGNSCTPCPTTANGIATCDGSACGFVCEPGFQRGAEGCEPGSNVEPPRPISPLSFGRVTSLRPTFTWELGAGSDGALIQVCADRACTDVVATEAVEGGATSVRLARELPLTPTGSRRVYFRLFGIAGGATGSTPSPTWSFALPARDAGADTSHGVIYDADGDGRADLAAGSADNQVSVYVGTDTGLTSSTTLTLAAGSEFGSAVAAVGDVDGDGYGDLVVGAPGLPRAYLYRGSETGLVATEIVLSGSTGEFGAAVAAAGDVNGDGYADVLAGAPGLGQVWLFFGGASVDGTVDVTFTDGGSRFGAALASIGDTDGDGKSEIALGAPGEGKVYVFRGADIGMGTIAATSATVTLSGLVTEGFGAALAGSADVNGDGRGDLLVGSPDASLVRLYLGSADGLEAEEARAWTSPNSSSSAEFGAALRSTGDINRDGYDDWLVGAPGVATAYIYQGSASNGQEDPVQTYSASSGSRFGAAVTSTGDVNGDGFDDSVIGAPGQERVSLYLHAAPGPDESATNIPGPNGFGGALAALAPFARPSASRSFLHPSSCSWRSEHDVLAERLLRGDRRVLLGLRL